MTVDFDTQQTSATRVIDATPEQIFGVLRDPSLHPVIDGSGTVKRSRGDAEALEMDSRFGMNMRLGVPYIMQSRVVEYDENRLIAWCHLGGHRWRFELEPVEGGTQVTETFDWSTAKSPKFIELLGYPNRHEPSLEKTLDRLEAYLSNRSDAL
jgi:hypothetical protein